MISPYQPWYQPYHVDWKEETLSLGPSGPSLPVNTVPPFVLIPGDGAPQLGENLTANDGTWTLNGGTLSRKWLRDGVDTGQTGVTYTLTVADQDTEISIEVTATNEAGSVMVPSSNAIIVQMNPKIQTPPHITYVFGQAPYVDTPAVWQLADTVTAIWRRNGADVAGQTSLTYTGTKQIGDSILYRSIGDNSYSSPVNSNSNAIVITGTADISQGAGISWMLSGRMSDSSQHAMLQGAGINWILGATMGDSQIQTIAQGAGITWTPSGSLV